MAILPDTADLIAAAAVAPLGAVVVVSVWAAISAISYPTPSPHFTLLNALGAFVGAAYGFSIFVVPIAWAITFVAGLPIALLWCRLHGGMGGFTAAVLGAALGASAILLPAFWIDESPRMLYLWLFTACGAATSLVFWSIALRNPT